MPLASKTFRIFISSTFSDLKEERNALQKHVFPKLKELCLQHGCRFQAIDLRWGVSEEAARDQQTMNICLGEIRRCQKTTPRPNFIALLGNRYGWCPVPPQIKATEFEEILERISPEERELILWREDQPQEKMGWYRRDDNAVPAEYCLRARTVHFHPNASDQEKRASMEAEAQEWSQIEEKLRSSFLQAIAKLTWPDNDPRRAKYEASATHQEIIHGTLSVPDAYEHVFCFLRDIPGLPHDKSARNFVDLNSRGEFDEAAHQRLEHLKTMLSHLLEGNVHEYKATWTGNGVTTDHIDQLCIEVYDSLSQVILRELRQLEEEDCLDREIAQHYEFLVERARFFIGREDILEEVVQPRYVSRFPGLVNLLDVSEDEVNPALAHRVVDPHPVAVWGVSGSGKSALMAKAIQRVQSNNSAEVIYRFIGTTPDSSSGRSLLESLCRQISRCYRTDESTIPLDYQGLVQDFPRRLALTKARKPLIIFLDALDQLTDDNDARNLSWLPAELPEHVRIIVSTLPEKCLSALREKLPSENFHELQSMSIEEGKELLQRWLDDARRTLQSHQREELLEKFRREGNGLPLYLKLAFEEARLWKSYFDSVETELGSGIRGAIRGLFDRLSAETNHGDLLVSRSLGYLATAKHGLTEDELLDVLARDSQLYAWFLKRQYQIPPDLIRHAQEYLEHTSLEEARVPVDDEAAEQWLRRVLADATESDKLHNFLVNIVIKPNGERLPVAIWSRLYFDLEPYFTHISADGTSTLNFFHRQFGEVVRELFLGEREQQERFQALSGYFVSQAVQLGREEQNTPNLRRLSELPYQQARANQWNMLRATLTDLSFIEAKVQYVGPQTLLEDYDQAYRDGYKEHDLSLIRGALSLSANVLDQDPKQLAGQLLGRLGTQEEPSIHHLLDRAKEWKGAPWLRPLTTSLTAPESPAVPTPTDHAMHCNVVTALPDGRRAIFGSRDATLKLWDLENGKEVRTFVGHEDSITAVAVLPDGRRVASGSTDETIKVWDVDSGKVIFTNGHSVPGYAYWVNTVALSPDGRLALSGSVDESIKVWDLETAEEVHKLKGHDGWVIALAILPDGRHGVSGSRDYTIKLWDLNTGKELRTLEGHQGWVNAVAALPDGKRVISGAGDGTIRIWQLDSGEQRILQGYGESVTTLALFPDGSYFISGSSDKTVRLWDLERGEVLASFTLEAAVNSCAVAPHTLKVVAVDESGKVHILQPAGPIPKLG